MKNKYAKRARISEAKIREIVRYVAADLTALQAAALSGLNRNTVNRLYRGVRERMLLACEAQRRLFGVVEVDESFFGARRVKGRRGRGAYGKTVVFGIFERQGHVYQGAEELGLAAGSVVSVMRVTTDRGGRPTGYGWTATGTVNLTSPGQNEAS